jgi:UDP-glucose:(glucosyl)LPS alpha-1,2-glucosyltransferase
MNFKIINASEEDADIGLLNDGTFANSQGGTELMMGRLMEHLPSDIKEEFNIICSRVRDGSIDENKKNILWLHDLWNDPENEHLRDITSRARFEKLVFVSNYQFQSFHMGHGIPYAESTIMRNAIKPIEHHVKPNDGVIRLIYHTTPHRGLAILVPVFERLYEKYGDRIVLDVYSSFSIYGWPQRDEEYKEVFAKCEEHPGINYHGAVSNDEIREALKISHIFAFPSIWPETSCIAAIEAMSAGVGIVCPNFAALPETTASLANIYQWNEDMSTHASYFASVLDVIIENYWHESLQSRFMYAKNYADNMYNWESRKEEWVNFLQSLK